VILPTGWKTSRQWKACCEGEKLKELTSLIHQALGNIFENLSTDPILQSVQLLDVNLWLQSGFGFANQFFSIPNQSEIVKQNCYSLLKVYFHHWHVPICSLLSSLNLTSVFLLTTVYFQTRILSTWTTACCLTWVPVFCPWYVETDDSDNPATFCNKFPSLIWICASASLSVFANGKVLP